MPTTSPDGIVYPDLNSVGDDIPAVLAALASSVQTALTDLRTDMEANETPDTITQAEFGTPSSGTTVMFFGLRRIGKLISGSMRLERAAGLTHGGVLFTVNTAYRPAVGQLLPMPNISSGGAGNMAASIGAALEADGDIIPLSPGSRVSIELGISWLIP